MEVSLTQAKRRWSELLARAEAGEEMTLTKMGRPVARLGTVPQRQPGRLESMIIADDFDAPLPDDLQQLFEGG